MGRDRSAFAATTATAAATLAFLLGLTHATPRVLASSPPTAYTGEAAQLTSTSALLKGAVYPGNQPTSYYFQYGTGTAYGTQTAAQILSGAQTVHVQAMLAGLSPGQLYHYRLVVASGAGAAMGADRSFTTKRIPLVLRISTAAPRTLYASPFTVTGILTGTGSAAHAVQLEANPFPYLAGFKPIGSAQLTDASSGFSFALTGLTQNTQLRVSTLDSPPVHSQVVPVRVAVRVALHIRPTHRPGYARLYGTVLPGEAGALVEIELIRAGGRRSNVGAARTRVAGDGSFARFARVVRVRRGALYRASVRALGAGLEPNRSRAIRVR